MTVTSSLPPFLSSSAGMLSVPGDLPAGRLRMASSTSSLMTGSGEGSLGGLVSSPSMLVSGCMG